MQLIAVKYKRHLSTDLFCNMAWFYLPLMHSKHYNVFIFMKINDKQSLNLGTGEPDFFWLVYKMICLPFLSSK